MLRFIASYYAIELVIIAIAVAATLLLRRQRLKRNQARPPAGFVKTDEVFIDPTTGIQQRVWYNPATGERYYETLEKSQ
ncbi:MAG: hypothetical protein K6T83_05400 [Alicyclobacillus sp.]|nr:hypothetical protein [Alicyclobacillus sp.]